MGVIEGKCFCVGDGVTAYRIISQARWTACGMDQAELGKWVFENLAPDAADKPGAFRDTGYSVVIAGTNFGGGGKSNDHPVIALKGAGIKLVVAESFSRIFFRNCINLGLSVMQCPGIASLLANDDILRCDLSSGAIENLTNGKSARAVPLNDLALKILNAGNLLQYYRKNQATPEKLFCDDNSAAAL